MISIPSASVAAISVEWAGISALVLLYNMNASLPILADTLTESIATSPPPITATRFPSATSLSRFTSLRNSTPGMTPSRSSPGIASFREPWVPTPRNTAE